MVEVPLGQIMVALEAAGQTLRGAEDLGIRVVRVEMEPHRALLDRQ
jgi:hypothetical protein